MYTGPGETRARAASSAARGDRRRDGRTIRVTPELTKSQRNTHTKTNTEELMPEPLTLMAVHAHPDDEAIGTGGVLARAAAEGVRTVLVTCTGGEVGEINPDTA